MMVSCPVDGTLALAGTKFCPECGSPMTQPVSDKCPQCGAPVKGAKFCPECGATIEKPVAKRQFAQVVARPIPVTSSVTLLVDASRYCAGIV